MTDAKERAYCGECGAGFDWRPGFFEERRLLPPRICAPCRESRAARLLEGGGNVVFVSSDGRYGFAVSDDGVKYVLHDTSGLERGVRVLFTFDPDEQPAPGRSPVARDPRPA